MGSAVGKETPAEAPTAAPPPLPSAAGHPSPKEETTTYTARGSAYECYICAEGRSAGPLLSVCACSGRYVHLRCQRELLHRMPEHEASCPVCKVPYTNAQTNGHSIRPTAAGQLFMFCICGIIVMMGAGIQQLYVTLFLRHETSAAEEPSAAKPPSAAEPLLHVAGHSAPFSYDALREHLQLRKRKTPKREKRSQAFSRLVLQCTHAGAQTRD